jgi:DNA-binding MarR family transcriptional regulator
MRASSESRAARGDQAGPAEYLAGDGEIVDAVLAANRLFVAVAATALAGVAPDVTLPQFRALVLLEQRGSMTVGALAAALGVVPSTATRMCDRLTAKKLVRRVTDRGNRRRVSVSLSGEGQRLIEQSTRRRSTQIAHLLASIPEADQQRIADALRLLVAAAGQ